MFDGETMEHRLIIVLTKNQLDRIIAATAAARLRSRSEWARNILLAAAPEIK
jgi:hypothetical protein